MRPDPEQEIKEREYIKEHDTVKCGVCGGEFTDSEEKMYIKEYGCCKSCALEEIMDGLQELCDCGNEISTPDEIEVEACLNCIQERDTREIEERKHPDDKS